MKKTLISVWKDFKDNRNFKFAIASAMAFSVVITMVLTMKSQAVQQQNSDFNLEFNKCINSLYIEYDCSDEVTDKIRTIECFVTTKMPKNEVIREMVKLSKEVGRHEVNHYQEDVLTDELVNLIIDKYEE